MLLLIEIFFIGGTYATFGLGAAVLMLAICCLRKGIIGLVLLIVLVNSYSFSNPSLAVLWLYVFASDIGNLIAWVSSRKPKTA